MNFTELISAIGFPSTCLVACGWYIYKIQTQLRNDSKERENEMYKQMNKFSKSLDSFNITLTKIDSRLEKVEKELTNR